MPSQLPGHIMGGIQHGEPWPSVGAGETMHSEVGGLHCGCFHTRICRFGLRYTTKNVSVTKPIPCLQADLQMMLQIQCVNFCCEGFSEI